MSGRAYVGTAAWTIPRAVNDRFPASGTHLMRYAQVLPAVEINTSFYRPHQRKVYERWAASTPRHFRFAVKMPKLLSHVQALKPPFEPLEVFMEQVAGLGDKLGPLLLQLPPKAPLDIPVASAFFETLRRLHPGRVACEPRHATFFTSEADALLRAYDIARVAADPPRHEVDRLPGGSGSFAYTRLHGSPRIYWSPYPSAVLDTEATALRNDRRERWLIFDNTAMGHATGDALTVLSALGATMKTSQLHAPG